MRVVRKELSTNSFTKIDPCATMKLEKLPIGILLLTLMRHSSRI